MSNTPLPEPDCRLPMDGPPRYRADQMHAHAAAVTAAKDAEIAQLRTDNTRMQNEVVMPLRERVRVLEDALRDVLVYDSVQTEYDGTVLRICPDCGRQDGAHSTNCAFVAARAALGDRT